MAEPRLSFTGFNKRPQSMGYAVFCRDGVLRIETSAFDRTRKRQRHFLVPPSKITGERTISSWSAHPVRFEEGLTVLELFRNLAPWSDEISAMAAMDFSAFMEEAEEEPENRIDDIEYVALSYHSRIENIPVFEAGARDVIKKPIGTKGLRIRSGWSYLGIFKPGQSEDETVRGASLDYSPLRDWSRLPIVIEHEFDFEDLTAAPPLPGRDLGVFNFLAGGVITHGRGLKIRAQAPEPYLYDAVIGGFLSEIGFHWTPEARDSALGSIKANLESALATAGPGREQQSAEQSQNPSSDPEEDQERGLLALLTDWSKHYPDQVFEIRK